MIKKTKTWVTRANPTSFHKQTVVLCYINRTNTGPKRIRFAVFCWNHINPASCGTLFSDTDLFGYWMSSYCLQNVLCARTSAMYSEKIQESSNKYGVRIFKNTVLRWVLTLNKGAACNGCSPIHTKSLPTPEIRQITRNFQTLYATTIIFQWVERKAFMLIWPIMKLLVSFVWLCLSII